VPTLSGYKLPDRRRSVSVREQAAQKNRETTRKEGEEQLAEGIATEGKTAHSSPSETRSAGA